MAGRARSGPRLSCRPDADGAGRAPSPVQPCLDAGFVEDDDPVGSGPDPVSSPPGEARAERRPERPEHRRHCRRVQPEAAPHPVAARVSLSPAAQYTSPGIIGAAA